MPDARQDSTPTGLFAKGDNEAGAVAIMVKHPSIAPVSFGNVLDQCETNATAAYSLIECAASTDESVENAALLVVRTN